MEYLKVCQKVDCKYNNPKIIFKSCSHAKTNNLKKLLMLFKIIYLYKRNLREIFFPFLINKSFRKFLKYLDVCSFYIIFYI